MPFIPAEITESQVIGRSIGEVSTGLGTYGMGGHGFLGLRLCNEWLVVAIDGAGEWIRADGVLVTDAFNDKSGRPKPWIDEEGDRLSPVIAGATISSLAVQRHAMELMLDTGMTLAIDATAEHRPVFEGTKQPRDFLQSDDLRRAVFLSPTPEIWV